MLPSCYSPRLPAPCLRMEERELQLQKGVTDALFKVSVSVIPLMGAVVGLAMSGLSGRQLGPTVWCGLSTVVVLVLGELQVVGQVCSPECQGFREEVMVVLG